MMKTIAREVGSCKDQRLGMPAVPTTNGHGREADWIGVVYVG